jgi:hypothetical protein
MLVTAYLRFPWKGHADEAVENVLVIKISRFSALSFPRDSAARGS